MKLHGTRRNIRHAPSCLTEYAAMTNSRHRLYQLIAHPATPCSAVQAITVEVRSLAHDSPAAPAGWRLRYRLQGDLSRLRVPPIASAPGPTDFLWQHTCFEAFVGKPSTRGYREFNFSPSGQWASYIFQSERVRDEGAGEWAISSPCIGLTLEPEALTLEANLAHSAPEEGELLLGLSAVIELQDGNLSYWALSHPSELADFHHKAGWTGRLISESAV